VTDRDSRLGFHYYPDEQHYTARDSQEWLPILGSLGAKWIVLRSSLQRAVPEDFIKGLLTAGIQPVVHIALRLEEVDQQGLSSILSAYAKWGLRYVVVLDRPNQRTAWSPQDWARGAITERFVDGMLPILRLQQSLGLAPILPPLEPGGDYWDTAFLEATLRSLLRRGQRAICDELVLSGFVRTHGHPLSWGAGGPQAWPEAKPYSRPAESEDQIGFHLPDWYAHIAERILGRVPSFLDVAGGATLPEAPTIDEQADHAATNAEIVRAFLDGEVPPFILNSAFYLLAAPPDHPDYASAWFREENSALPVVDRIRSLIRQRSQMSKVISAKPIPHYVLLPMEPPQSSSEAWRSIASFASAFRPTIGFDPEIAKLAQVVSLAGDEAAIPARVERELCACGCVVHRVPSIVNGSLLDTMNASSSQNALNSSNT
jgi:hypothetical protein